MRTRILDNPDKIRNDFCIDPAKLALSGFTVISGLVLGITFLTLRNWAGAGLMFLIMLLFLRQAYIYGPWISVTPDGIRKHIFGRTLKLVRWEDVAEVGVVGTKVFNKLTPDKTGAMYIYFSPKTLNEEERFQLALDFPPKDMLFLRHEKEREDIVQVLWNTKMVGYNIGKLKL